MSAVAATMHRLYAPRGHFRPWAKLTFSEATHAYRFAYPTLLCANRSRAFLHDVRTGALVQTINIRLSHRQSVCYVDVNERHAFVCDPEALHVYARQGDGRDGAGAKVLRISRSVPVQKAVEPNVAPGNPFFTVLPLRSEIDGVLPRFIAGASTFSFPATEIGRRRRRRRLFTHIFPLDIAHVSRDGRDLVIMASRDRLLLIRDFERIFRGDTSIAAAGQVLRLLPGDECCYLAFEHGRVCVATVSPFVFHTLLACAHVSLFF